MRFNFIDVDKVLIYPIPFIFHKSNATKLMLQTEAHTDGDFAFIHDASEVRYQYYINCNFSEVGEPFAEQPLAVAVQQVNYRNFYIISPQ